MPFQNVTVNDGFSKFVRVEPNGTLSELHFSSKRSNLPLGSGHRVQVVSGSIVLQKKVNVAANGETPVYFTKTQKLTFNDQQGATASITAQLDELLAALTSWRASYNADNGLVPTAVATIAES